MKINSLLLVGFIFTSFNSFADTSKIITQELKGQDSNANFDFQYPFVTEDFGNDEVANKVNHSIWSSLDKYRCDVNSVRHAAANGSTGFLSSTKANIERADSTVLSFELNYDEGCGQLNGGFGVDTYNYDLKTGAAIDLTTQFQNFNLFKRLAIKRFLEQKPSGNADCSALYTFLQLSSQDMSFLIINGGLKARIAYASAEAICDYAVKFTNTEIHAYAKAGSFLSNATK